MDDVVNLVLANSVNLDDAKWTALFTKSSTLDLLSGLNEQSRPEPAPQGEDSPALELPDGTGFVSQGTPRTLEQMLPIMDEYRKWFPEAIKRTRELRKERCTEEFIL